MKSKSEQWIDALDWANKNTGVPTIVSLMIKQHAAKVMRKAKPFKASIKIPNDNKLVTPSKLKKELDRVFSIFIRERDSNEYGIGRCVTCGLTKHWREMDAGHYVPRQDLATRWDEKNVHIQCKKCNGFRGGEPEKMAEYIDFWYGSGESEGLRAKAKEKFRPTRDWMQSKIKHYKAINGEI